MERFNDAVRTVCDLLWNFPMLVLLAGTHLYFTIRLGFIQRKLPDGLRRSLSSAGSGGLSPYEALSTALAAMQKACCPQRAGKSGQTEAFMADRCM